LALVCLATLPGVSNDGAAQTPDRWRSHPAIGVLDSVTIRFHWYESSAELRDAAENGGREINARGLHGFSVLRRNTETGEYVCDVFVLKMRGAFVDGDRTMTFGHEILHCVGLGHE
jgi:hypothetical protein